MGDRFTRIDVLYQESELGRQEEDGIEDVCPFPARHVSGKDRSPRDGVLSSDWERGASEPADSTTSPSSLNSSATSGIVCAASLGAGPRPLYMHVAGIPSPQGASPPPAMSVFQTCSAPSTPIIPCPTLHAGLSPPPFSLVWCLIPSLKRPIRYTMGSSFSPAKAAHSGPLPFPICHL